jgi:threonine aldolase
LLAETLANIEGVAIDPDTVETNIVIFRLTGRMTAGELVARLKAHGILASAVGGNAIRLVTHHDVSRADCITAGEALTEEIEATATVK